MTKPAENRDCPYCQNAIEQDESKVVCPECGIAHHAHCWQANQKCSVYGCNGWAVSESGADDAPAAVVSQPPAAKTTAPAKVQCIKCGVEIRAGKMLCWPCRKKQPTHYMENCFGPSLIMLGGFIGIIVFIVKSMA